MTSKSSAAGFRGGCCCLIGFALGIIFTLSVSIGRSGTQTMIYGSDAVLPDNYAARATLLVSEATLHAQAAQNYQIASEYDPLLATATAIILQATQQASNP